MNDLLVLLILCFVTIIFIKSWKLIIFPKLIDKTTEVIEKNPKWITPKLRDTYYGFSDIDIIIARSTIGALPRFRMNSEKGKKDRLELLLPEETSINDIDKIAQLALRGKIGIFYGLMTPDKPAQWLAILLYMLDGGDIKQ